MRMQMQRSWRKLEVYIPKLHASHDTPTTHLLTMQTKLSKALCAYAVRFTTSSGFKFVRTGFPRNLISTFWKMGDEVGYCRECSKSP